MARYAAFLRGVGPTNLEMAALRGCFEAAGFGEVRTLLASGNVVFSVRATSAASLQRRIESVLEERFGRTFLTLVRSADALDALLSAEPYAAFRLEPAAKRIVTFLRAAPTVRLTLPVESDGARILCRRGTEVFSDYLPSARGPVFMELIEKTFGREQTTRTWETVRKVAAVTGQPAVR